MAEVADGNTTTCSQIQNGTFSVTFPLYEKIRGVTIITIETKGTQCIPPKGLTVSVGYCEEFKTCSLRSTCYSKPPEIEGHCVFHCNWMFPVMANGIIVYPHSDDFQLCEIDY